MAKTNIRVKLGNVEPACEVIGKVEQALHTSGYAHLTRQFQIKALAVSDDPVQLMAVVREFVLLE